MMNSSNELSKKVLQLAQQGYPRLLFLEKLSMIILDYTGSDALEIRLADINFPYSWQYSYNEPSSLTKKKFITDTDGVMIPCQPIPNSEERICRNLMQPKYNPELKYYYSKSSIIIEDAWHDNHYSRATENSLGEITGFISLIYCSFITSRDINGLLVLKKQKKSYFNSDNRHIFESLATSLGIAIAFQRSQYVLRERVKELTCLHSMNKLLQENDLNLEDISHRLVNMVPDSFQYPHQTYCRLVVEDKEYFSKNYKESSISLHNDIIIQKDKAGEIEVYLNDEDNLEFLSEEHDLLRSIAGTAGAIIRKLHHESDKKVIREQLRHADRLATIGQLASGIAHELNEPLANILGYAELLEQSLSSSKENLRDLNKIINSSLYARDVVKKLLLFARQMPTLMRKENLNKIIKESMDILENRIRKSEIELAFNLESDLPEILADASQIKQIIINLVVNSEQAMPKGGKISISTFNQGNNVCLIVEDNGIGMSSKILKKIFMPFFSTKKAGEGTGLGLSVVFGIIKSHNAKIEVSSQLDKGSRFSITFPHAKYFREEDQYEKE